MIRLFDFIASLLGLVVLSPFLLLFMLLVWLQDRKSPLYLAPRVSKGGGRFTMVKLRSMVVGADRSGVDSTASGDARVTSIGRIIRKFKLDEFTQLWNVLIGDMSLVGPRPQVQRDVDLYTDVERGLLSVTPGITDISSIVFSDEGEILAGREDPDLAYNQLIRPWKSRLGLFYIEHRSLTLNVRLILLTVSGILSRQTALRGVGRILETNGADENMVDVARRASELTAFPPPGTQEIVTSR